MEAAVPQTGPSQFSAMTSKSRAKELDRRLMNEEPKDIRYLDIDKVGIHYSTLTIDGRRGYQRGLNTRKIEKMVDEFDPMELTAIVVSERADGSYWVLDGQHRLEALKLLGKSVILADVRHGLSFAQEARLFYRLNAGHTPVDAWAKFQSRLVWDPKAQLIERTINKYGYHLDRGGASTRGIAAVRSLEIVHDEGLLEDVFDIVSRVWRADGHGVDGPVLEGLAIFLRSYRGQPAFDMDRLLDILAVTPPSAVLQRQRKLMIEMGRSNTRTAATIAIALRDTYNGKRSSRKLSGPPMSRASGRRIGTGRTLQKHRARTADQG